MNSAPEHPCTRTDSKVIRHLFFGAVLFYVAIALFFFHGCCAPPQTITRTEYIDVPVVVHDTITAYMEPDSSWWGRDTVITIQFKDRTFKYWIHDTLKVKYTDTVQVVKQEIIKTPLLSKLGLVLIGMAVAVGGIVALKFVKPL